MTIKNKKKVKIFAILIIFAFVYSSVIFGVQCSDFANSYNSSNPAPTSIGSLTLSDYAARSDGNVFDGNILNKLYSIIAGQGSATYDDAKNTITSSKSEIMGACFRSSSDVAIDTTIDNDGLSTQLNSMNFSQIKQKNGGSAITVGFGGYTWNVVYLTTNTNAGTYGDAGDVIATLWMSDVINNGEKYYWNEFGSLNTGDVNASNVYGNSPMRVATLNNGSADKVDTAYKMGTSGAPYYVQASDRINNEFAKFTMTNDALSGTKKANTSLIEFLATPSQVNYQKHESWVWSLIAPDSNSYLVPNEAWGESDINIKHSASSSSNRTGGWYGSGTANNMNQVIQMNGYDEWKNDYLWLPSITETGFNENSVRGISLWGIETKTKTDEILLSSADIWLRSGTNVFANMIYALSVGGESRAYSTSGKIGAMRPALHLNLTKASQNCTKEVDVPTNATVTYNGEEWSVDKLNPADKAWYDSSIISLDYPTDMTNAGVKTVTATIAEDSKYTFKNSTTAENAKKRTFTINITKKKITVNFDENNITNKLGVIDKDVGTSRAPELVLKYSLQSGGAEFTTYPTVAGKYKVRVVINNPTTCNYELDDTTSAKSINFDVRGAVSVTADDIIWQVNDNVMSSTSLPWSPNPYTISISNYTKDGATLADKGVKIQNYSGNITESNVSSSYVAKVKLVNLDNTFDNFSEEFSLNWAIEKHVLAKPAYSGGDIVFDNRDVDFITLLGVPSDWADYLTIDVRKNGTAYSEFTAREIGDYVLVFRFKNSLGVGNVVWENPEDPEDIDFVSITVKIVPRVITVKGWTSSGIPNVQVDDVADREFINRTYTNLNGDPVTYEQVTEQFNTTFRVKAESKFGDNVRVVYDDGVDDFKEFTTPADPLNPATPIARPTIKEDSKFYTGSTLTFELEGFDDTIMAIATGSLSVTDVGDYSITIRFREGANYVWSDDNSRDSFTLTFSVVTDPDNPTPTPPPGEGTTPGENTGNNGENGNFIDKVREFFDNLIASDFPLWQICTMAVAGLLTLIFLIKSIQYGNRRKKIVGKGKKNTKVNSALLPVFATDIVLANLSNQVWSIMAFAFVGLALIMFVVALITRKRWKKAELAQEEGESSQLTQIMQALQSGNLPVPVAQSADQSSIIEEMRRQMEEQRREDEARRREEEARHRAEMDALREEQARRDEEQAKRDEAMKLMLANMMGRQQGNSDDMPYYGTVEDTDLLVQKVIAGLLPAVQQMMPENTAYLTAPAYEQSENDIEAIADRVAEKLGAQIAPVQQSDINLDTLAQKVSEKIIPATNTTIVQDVSDEKMDALNAKIAQMQQKMDNMAFLSVDELDDTDFDDEEEWDSILDEDDDDFVEAVIIEEGGTVRKTTPNFRMRLKQSSEKNREWYTVIKNMFCSQKGVTYRVCKRVEKIRYQGQVVGVIGIAKRSIKLWLALKPYEYDARRYHHKDVSDKPRFVDVPMYIRVGSDRALTRAQELILALFQELNMEARKRYNDRDIQELIFTLKHNKLLTNKQNKQLLCEVMHVHDCDVLSDELAEKCVEFKNVADLDDSLLATVKLDDIDAKFQDGNRVTLDKLKKVGLVSEECTGFTVTADKRLTKPLIIVANDFSLTAVKLITLTGGRAIKLTQV